MDISVRGVSKVYESRSGPLVALRGVDLQIPQGKFVSLVGVSGCGKTTLLEIIAGLTFPTSGEVAVGGKRVVGPGLDRPVVFQGDAVFPWMTVAKNVEYGLVQMGVERRERKERVQGLLDLVGLTEFRNAYPKELSGGMKKRVDLARAYAVDPDVLLMDEPFGMLDAITKEKMQVDLLELTRSVGKEKTVIFVTHDLEEGLFISDSVVIMTPRPGRIREIVEVPFGRDPIPAVKTTPEFQTLRRRLSVSLATEANDSVKENAGEDHAALP